MYTGELNVLSGRRALVSIRAAEAGELIEIEREALRTLVQTDSQLSDIFLRAFILRRLELIARDIGGSGTNLFDVAQLQANSTVNENSAALRFDYKLNNKRSAYFRFFRDQGSNDQPEGVTGRRVAIKAVPQNGVLAVQSLLTPTLLNEFKFGYNSAYTRINGQAPTIAGFDLSSAVINISGNTANFALPGQGTSAGTAVDLGQVNAYVSWMFNLRGSRTAPNFGLLSPVAHRNELI
jgi:hypothetical protein